MDEIADRNMRERPDEVFWFLWGSLDYLRRAVADEDEDALDAVTAFAQAIERFSDLVGTETLATALRPGLTGRGHAWAGDLNGVAAQLELEKV